MTHIHNIKENIPKALPLFPLCPYLDLGRRHTATVNTKHVVNPVHTSGNVITHMNVKTLLDCTVSVG